MSICDLRSAWSIQMRQDLFDLQRHRFATRKMMSHMPGIVGKIHTHFPWENDCEWWMFQMLHIQLNSLLGRCFSLDQIIQGLANRAGHWTTRQLSCSLQQNSLWFGDDVCQPHLQLIRSWCGMTISCLPVFDTQVAFSDMVQWFCVTFLQDRAFVLAIHQALTKLELLRITPKLQKLANWFVLTPLSKNTVVFPDGSSVALTNT